MMSSKPTSSWIDALAALSSTLPEGDEVAEVADVEHKPAKLPKLRIEIDRKGRAGKTATIISGFADGGIDDVEVSELASQLKKFIGAGGSARGGEILVQGDVREKSAAFFEGKGFKVRVIG